MLADVASGAIDGVIRVAWYGFLIWIVLKCVSNYKKGKSGGQRYVPVT